MGVILCNIFLTWLLFALFLIMLFVLYLESIFGWDGMCEFFGLLKGIVFFVLKMIW